jgi:hypothetical protein
VRLIQLVGAVVALIVSVYVSRIVFHGLTDHDHLDVFHLVVAVILAGGALLLLYRAARGSAAGA